MNIASISHNLKKIWINKKNNIGIRVFYLKIKLIVGQALLLNTFPVTSKHLKNYCDYKKQVLSSYTIYFYSDMFAEFWEISFRKVKFLLY